MSDFAIRVENLGKEYRIGGASEGYKTLRESISGLALGPVRALRSMAGRGPERRQDESFWALKDVSFEVKRGEVVGVIGRNGAGKSTLLKVLSRITEPTTGSVRIRGRVGSLLEIGTGFHPELSGRENIFLNGAILGMPRSMIEKKFDEIVDFAEVEKFIDMPVKRYSSGMYLKLAFAVAAHLEPEILVVDEVLAVGDAHFQKKCLGKMGDVAKQGRTVFFVSHNMDAIRRLCSKGILLSQGTKVLEDTAGACVTRYMESSESAQAEYDIAVPKGQYIPGYAYKLRTEDKDGQPTITIPVGQPWQVRVYFNIDERINSFVIGLGMRTISGGGLRTAWSEPRSIEPGQYCAVFQEDVLLLSVGRYSLIVGLSSQDHTFHYTDEAGTLEIAEYAVDFQNVRIANAGIIVNKMKVSIEPQGQ